MTTCPTCGGSGVYESPELSHIGIPHILSPYDDEPCDADGMSQYDHADCTPASGRSALPDECVEPADVVCSRVGNCTDCAPDRGRSNHDA